MRVLLIGRMDGWMGVYLSQLSKGFLQEGVECRTFNYRTRSLIAKAWQAAAREKERAVQEERTRRIVKVIQSFSPDVVITNGGRFDLSQIHDVTKGRVVFWDMDGPEGQLVRDDFPWEGGVDIVFTVSRPVARRFSQPFRLPVFYLPHGVDTDFYCPGAVSSEQLRRFHAPFAFVGRVCERRQALLEHLVDFGLAVWGKSWSSRPVSPRLKECLREKADITGQDLVDLYRSSHVVLNVLRDPFIATPSILSLQAFSIPASGACLLTDWVDELEEAYDPEQEVVAFGSVGELIEKAKQLTGDREKARRIGKAGRRRTEADHSLRQRARSILAAIERIW